MDDTKDSSVNSEPLHSDGGSDNKALEKKEEKQPSHMTLHKKEMIESDESSHLFRRKQDPEALESVHKYAKRIKSFLGWEPFSDELAFEKGDGLTGGVDDENDVPELEGPSGTSEVRCEDENLNEGEEEGVSDKSGDKSDELERDSSPLNSEIDPVNKHLTGRAKSTDIPPVNEKNESGTDENVLESNKVDCDEINSLIEAKENLTESELTSEMEGADMNIQSTQETEMDNNTEVFSEDNSGVNNNNTLDNPFTETNNEIRKIVDTDSSGEINGKAEIKALERNESPPPREPDLTKNSSLPSENENRNTNVSSDNSGDNLSKNIPNEISEEDIVLSEINNCDKDFSTTEDRKAEQLDNSILDDSKDIEKTKDFTVDKEDDIKNDVPESEVFDNIKEEQIQSSDSYVSEKDNVRECQSEEIAFPTSSTENITDDKIKNNGITEDDPKSEDSISLNKSIPLKNNINKPYVDEVRRLSRDIVKYVIESARNSVSELYSTKNENTETVKVPTNLENNNGTNENQESHFTNGTKMHKAPLFSKTEAFEGKNNLLDVKHPFECHAPKENKEPFKINDIGNQTKEIVSQEEGEVDKDTICGYGCFKPNWIQRYATPRAYLILFSIIGIIHGCYYAYFVSIISTLEKRYAFKTKVSGTLLLADEITPLILGVIVGYIGGRSHRPRMVCLGMLMSVACCFITGLPYLIYGPAKHLSFINYKNETGPEICEISITKMKCDGDDLPPTMTVVGIFLLASFLKGFATLSYYVIGISYMDDIIQRKNSPMYLAIALALRLLGPLVGFLMSSGFLKLYENPMDDPGFGPDDPRWIGAWWIGFFLQGVLLLIFTLPIALFPRRLPSQKKVEKPTSSVGEDGLKNIFLGLVSALKRLGKNPVFIVLIVNTTMKIFGHFGHSIMLPKYMENQFRLSASEASLFSGATSIACIMVSTVLGGFLIWKFRPSIKVLIAGMIVSEVILCAGFLTLMVPRCKTADMMHFGMNDDGLILNNVCNQNCECSTTSFTPFCGPDGKTTYFSPCYAGCTQELVSSMSPTKNKEYGNCSCVTDDGQQEMGAIISEGFCPDENCWNQTLAYLIILFFLVTTSNLFTVAHTMILLRAVHPNDKSVALGTFETFICLFGFIPFPVAFGALVDSACLVWEKSCGETGNCWFYDMEKYSYLLHGVAALFCSLSVVCLITLYFLSSRVRNLYVDDEEEEKENVVNIKLDTVSGSVTKL